MSEWFFLIAPCITLVQYCVMLILMHLTVRLPEEGEDGFTWYSQMLGLYILDANRRPVKLRDGETLRWSKWFERTADRIVGRWAVDGMEVSTVCMGIDHSFGGGPPLIFETMVFGGAMDGEQLRCSTWEEAEAQHEEVLRRVRALVQAHRPPL